jgi:hypothetical protein
MITRRFGHTNPPLASKRMFRASFARTHGRLDLVVKGINHLVVQFLHFQHRVCFLRLLPGLMNQPVRRKINEGTDQQNSDE